MEVEQVSVHKEKQLISLLNFQNYFKSNAHSGHHLLKYRMSISHTFHIKYLKEDTCFSGPSAGASVSRSILSSGTRSINFTFFVEMQSTEKQKIPYCHMHEV